MSAVYDRPDELIHVAVRKQGLDGTSPWWQRAYFRYIWRPFMRFSFRVFRIPAPDKMNRDGSFSFLEGIAIATDAEIATEMCKDESYRLAWLPVNSSLPRESVQYKAHVYPRSVMPDRYRRRTFPRPESTEEAAAVHRGLDLAIAKVDEMLTRSRSSPV